MDFFRTAIAVDAVERASGALKAGWVSEGARVREFEQALSARLGLCHPVAVNSGTSGLHLALDVAGVGVGDEVLLPAQTFVATGLAILMQHAVPVFVDVQPHTGNLEPASLRARISGRTRAIMPVHWAGYPCDMDEINAIAKENGLAVVEDAAHALGARYRGRPVGSLSRFTVFSFQAIKHVTTGDGGAICCLEEADADVARRRRWFGIDRARHQADILGERVYDLDHVGFKYHMNDLAAAVGLGNLPGLDAQLRRRRAVAARYREALADVAGLTLLEQRPDREHAFWLFTVLVERREAFIRKLAFAGVPASVVHRRIDRYSVLGGARADLPGQAAFDAAQVSIPIHELLSDEDIETVIQAIRSGW